MNWLSGACVSALLAMTAAAATDAPAALKIPRATRQLVVVSTAGWNVRTGSLRRWARGAGTAEWRPVGESWPVVVGKQGLAWGRGLHRLVESSAPRKRERDGRAPAGLFRLGRAFGCDAKPGGVRLDYLRITENTEAVDDPQSRFYNRIVERTAVPLPDWKSSEQMAKIGAPYRWGVVVAHNAAPVVPGAGSCIFLHVWREAQSGTAGCTAMAPEHVPALLRWLDPAQKPLLLQLPRSAFHPLALDAFRP